MSSVIAPVRVPRPRRFPRPPTREVTLYRLLRTCSTDSELLDVLDATKLDEQGLEIHFPSLPGMPALLVSGHNSRDRAEWCHDLSLTTGLDIALDDRRAGALLLVTVDDHSYAIGYGNGWRLLPEAAKDPRFGLSFAVRRLDVDQVDEVVRRQLGARGRTEATYVPEGISIWNYDVQDHADLVGRAGGRIAPLPLTYCGDEERPIRVKGAAGLRLHLGVQAADLRSDIREIARVCAEEEPRPGLEFIERIQPVTDPETLGRLDTELDRLLGERPEVAAEALAQVVPTRYLDELPAVRSYGIKINSTTPRVVENLELTDLLARTNAQRAGHRVNALREGEIRLYTDRDGREMHRSTKAALWLEATVSLGARQYALTDGHWYEVDAGYLESLRVEVEQLLAGPPSLKLPTWDAHRDEGWYNRTAQDITRNAYVCLDKKGVHTTLHRRNGFEACDLLGPDHELIHVKRADGSAPLSHLFQQALVSATELCSSPEARSRFATVVAKHGRGRTVPVDFTPRKVVFAILLKGGRPLTADSLFPFSRVALVQAARFLRHRYQISVEVIGIEPSRTP